MYEISSFCAIQIIGFNAQHTEEKNETNLIMRFKQNIITNHLIFFLLFCAIAFDFKQQKYTKIWMKILRAWKGTPLTPHSHWHACIHLSVCLPGFGGARDTHDRDHDHMDCVAGGMLWMGEKKPQDFHVLRIFKRAKQQTHLDYIF